MGRQGIPAAPTPLAADELDLAALARLAAGVAHDLANSLGAISLRCAALAETLRPDDPHATEVEEIRHMAEASAERMRHVLRVCRGAPAAPEPVELGAAVRAALPALRSVAGPHVELVLEMASPPSWVALTQGAVEHMLVNLTSNAVHAMGGDGRVTVSIARDGPWALLSVADEGAGMDAAARAKAPLPFFTTRAEKGGSGLGLTAVADVVGYVGGHLEIASEPGEGTTVSLWLPAG